MEWYNLLSEDLLNCAYKANGEMAWDRQNAVRVIRLLDASGYVVLGVDIWLPTKPGPTIPTPAIYDWALEMSRAATEYPKSAEAFVQTFVWDESDPHRRMIPYFNITARRRNS